MLVNDEIGIYPFEDERIVNKYEKLKVELEETIKENKEMKSRFQVEIKQLKDALNDAKKTIEMAKSDV